MWRAFDVRLCQDHIYSIRDRSAWRYQEPAYPITAMSASGIPPSRTICVNRTKTGLLREILSNAKSSERTGDTFCGYGQAHPQRLTRVRATRHAASQESQLLPCNKAMMAKLRKSAPKAPLESAFDVGHHRFQNTAIRVLPVACQYRGVPWNFRNLASKFCTLSGMSFLSLSACSHCL